MSLIHILFTSLQALNFVAHLVVLFAMLYQYIELKSRKCICCGLSSCIRAEVAMGHLPYSEWKRKKLSGPETLRLE